MASESFEIANEAIKLAYKTIKLANQPNDLDAENITNENETSGNVTKKLKLSHDQKDDAPDPVDTEFQNLQENVELTAKAIKQKRPHIKLKIELDGLVKKPKKPKKVPKEQKPRKLQLPRRCFIADNVIDSDTLLTEQFEFSQFITDILKDPKSSMLWLAERGLLPNSTTCINPDCNNNMMSLQAYAQCEEGYKWRCSKGKCQKKRSIRIGSFFERARLPLGQIVAVIYFWAQERQRKSVTEELGLCQACKFFYSFFFFS